MADNWLARRGSKVIGPLPATQLLELAKSGKLLRTDEISRDGGNTWTYAATVFSVDTPRPAVEKDLHTLKTKRQSMPNNNPRSEQDLVFDNIKINVSTKRTEAIEGAGSLEGGIAGNYNFSISDVISEAWAKTTNGAKGTIWLAVLFCNLAGAPVCILFVPISTIEIGLFGSMSGSQIVLLIALLMVYTVLLPGLLMIGVKIASQRPTDAIEPFSYRGKALPLLITTILYYIMVTIGLGLMIFPGIYLSVAYIFAPLLVLDKNLGAWEALEASRKAVTHHWFKTFWLFWVFAMIYIIGAIPYGLGLIWTLPMGIIVYGILYIKIFGFSNAISPKPTPPKLTPLNFSHLSQV